MVCVIGYFKNKSLIVMSFFMIMIDFDESEKGKLIWDIKILLDSIIVIGL